MAFNFRKKNFTYTYVDFYRNYKKKKRASGFKPREIIDQKKYLAAMEDFFILLCRKIVTQGFIFVLPFGLGCIFLKAIKGIPGKTQIDWGTSNEIGKIVHHMNRHTFGYYYRVLWQKSHVSFRNKTLYKFSFVTGEWARKKNTGKPLVSMHLFKVANDPDAKSVRKI